MNSWGFGEDGIWSVVDRGYGGVVYWDNSSLNMGDGVYYERS